METLELEIGHLRRGIHANTSAGAGAGAGAGASTAAAGAVPEAVREGPLF
jgi:hypothetical protein